MQSGTARIAAAMAFALSVAACNTTGQQAGGLQTGQRTTLAFESIDGPPPAVFQRLVQKLNEEAETRQVPVVSREGFAPYRVRGYVAVGVRRGQATVAWVWDVYDAQAGRTLRLSGEERAGRAGRDAWAAVNDEVLSRIAKTGMEQLAVYFRNPDVLPQSPPAATPDQPAPDQPGTAVARSDDFRPESYGITRRAQETPEAAPPATTGIATPVPPRRPSSRTGRVALAPQER